MELNMPKFKIEQIAIAPVNKNKAMELLKEMGAEEWISDIVVASGNTNGHPSLVTNVAELDFNYDLIDGKEFEILEYIAGQRWIINKMPCVSHLGMHCTTAELKSWKAFFSQRGIDVAQEVITKMHSNPAIRDERRYNYVIFDTRDILGVDLKFIVRLNMDGTPYECDNS